MPTLRSGLKVSQTDQNKDHASATTARKTMDRNEQVGSSDFAKALSDTIKHSATKIEGTEGTSARSTFQLMQPAPIPRSKNPKFPFRGIEVVQIECLNSWMLSLLDASPKYKGKIALACSASSLSPAGILNDDPINQFDQSTPNITHEQTLCATSTLYANLTNHRSQYPWPSFTAPPPGYDPRKYKLVTVPTIFSPEVTIFKAGSSGRFASLPDEQRSTMAIISISPPRNVDADDMDSIVEMGNKIVTIFRLAAMHGKTVLVVDDFGCADATDAADGNISVLQRETTNVPGYSRNIVAKDVADLLLHIAKNDSEFRGCFERIYFLSTSEEVCDIFRAFFTIDELGVNLAVS